jgi:hypothetical protein
MWCLHNKNTYLERQLVNYVYCVIISDVVFASTTNIRDEYKVIAKYVWWVYALYTIQQLAHAYVYVLTTNVN